MKKLNIGMVGTGFIADWHYKGFSQNKNAQITGITRNYHGSSAEIDRQKKQLNAKAEALGIKAYDDYQQMLSDSNIDALIIGSVNPYHYDQIKAAIDANKPIMVEKPVLTNLNELKEIEGICNKNGFKLFPAHNFVYRGAVKKAREIIDSGKIGHIIHSSFIITHTISENHATGWRSKLSLSSGGTLMDSGHHLVYQTLFLLGIPVKIQGFTSKMVLKKMEGEDTAQVSLLYEDGSMATIMQSWASNHADNINGIRIIGTEGSLVISDALYVNGEKVDNDADYENSFINQASAFVEYVLHDTPPLSGLKDVENTLKIIYGCYESNLKDKTLSL